MNCFLVFNFYKSKSVIVNTNNILHTHNARERKSTEAHYFKS